MCVFWDFFFFFFSFSLSAFSFLLGGRGWQGELSCPLGGNLASNWTPGNPTNEPKRSKGRLTASSQGHLVALETGKALSPKIWRR